VRPIVRATGAALGDAIIVGLGADVKGRTAFTFIGHWRMCLQAGWNRCSILLSVF
jgi:hypothetical protein